MKKALKIILICVLIAGLLGGGAFAYLKLRKKTPCEVYPAMQWMMSYMPNQSYLYGIVTSDASQIITNERDRDVLEILVNPGDVVSVGDPLLRYDATRTKLEYEQKQLDLRKLEDKLREEYAEYRRYARQDYEEPFLTPTPSPTPRTYRNGVSNGPARGVIRLGTRTHNDLSKPTEGTGSKKDPYRYELEADGIVPYSFLQTLLKKAGKKEKNIHAVITQPEAEISVTAAPDGTFSFSVKVKGDHGTADLSKPMRGSGSGVDPFLYAYASKTKIDESFLSVHREAAKADMRDRYVTLQAERFSVVMMFGPDGSLVFKTVVLAPTATPTPTPTPTPSPTPSETATLTPEPTPYHGGGMSRAEREALVREIAKNIRSDELSYRQMLLDLSKAERKGLDGYLLSEINGTVISTAAPDEAGVGETLIEIRGGTGLHISVMLGESDLEKYPVGTELTGFSYESNCTITARVSKVGTMPLTTSYQNGSGVSGSGYLAVLDIVGDETPRVYEYIEFSDYSSLYEQGTIYLHEAFLREIDGETCLFAVRNDVLERIPVQTGSRMNGYVELIGSPITPEDRIAFPYDKNCKEGNPVKDAQNSGYFGYGW